MNKKIKKIVSSLIFSFTSFTFLTYGSVNTVNFQNFSPQTVPGGKDGVYVGVTPNNCAGGGYVASGDALVAGQGTHDSYVSNDVCKINSINVLGTRYPVDITGSVTVEIRPGKPRRNAFDVYICKGAPTNYCNTDPNRIGPFRGGFSNEWILDARNFIFNGGSLPMPYCNVFGTKGVLPAAQNFDEIMDRLKTMHVVCDDYRQFLPWNKNMTYLQQAVCSSIQQDVNIRPRFYAQNYQKGLALYNAWCGGAGYPWLTRNGKVLQ